MLTERLKRNGEKVLDRYSRTGWFRYLSPMNLSLWKALERAAGAHVRGQILDAGAGRKPYEGLLRRFGESYTSVDIGERVPGIDTLVDLHELNLDRRFDTIVCTQVLEHTRSPELVLARLREHLVTGGRLILTVPHLSMLHNEPHDYFRFTRHGLRELFAKTGFCEVEIRPVGGFWAFAGHLVSTFCVNLVFGIPVLGPCAVPLNAPAVIAFDLLDRILGFPSLLPANYLAVAQAKGSEAGAPGGTGTEIGAGDASEGDPGGAEGEIQAKKTPPNGP